jgi:hypothetical protein
MDLMGIPERDRPRLHWLIDPVDYLKPIVYDTDNPAWADPDKKAALSGYCAPSGSAAPVRVSLQ